MIKEVGSFVPTVLFHGTGEYNIPVITAHGLASSRDTLTPSLTLAMTGAWQQYRGQGQCLTIWYPQPGDVRTYSSDSTSYHIENPITEAEKSLLISSLKLALEGQFEIEIRYRLSYFQELDRLLPASRLGAYFLLDDTIGKFLHELEMNSSSQKTAKELILEMQKAKLICFNNQEPTQIAADIITTVEQFRRISPRTSS